MRIAIVNDLALAVTAIRRVLLHDGRHTVAWVARDGIEALARYAADRPDLILLDLVMPELDGIQTTRRLMEQGSCPPILIVTATVGQRAGLVFEAMGHGALDAVKLPQLTLPAAESGRELLGRIRTLERLQGATTAGPSAGSRAGRTAPAAGVRPPLVAIGSSTGGPGTLAQLLGALPCGLPAAFVVVQHIDAEFAGGLIAWLNERIPMPVIAAEPGTMPPPGTVCLARSNDHLVLEPSGRFAHVAEPQHLAYRPSVDVFFGSLERHWPSPGQAVLLTGMGQDGAAGLLALRRKGWHTIAQDEASCSVYGMPRAAVERGGAVEVLPPDAIARSLLRHLGGPGRRTGG